MSDKEKIIGSICILILGLFFLIIGYKISKTESVQNENGIFVEHKNNNYKSKFKNEDDPNNKDNFINKDKNEKCKKDNNTKIMVDIRGEIKKPGIYSLSNQSRINDLVNLAGGFTSEADINSVHLSKKLKDEDYIYIPKVGENNELNVMNNKTLAKDEDKKVNLNTATLEELKTISGIGEVTANKIIEYRENVAPFEKVEDLMKIDRIGAKTFEKLKDKVDIK